MWYHDFSKASHTKLLIKLEAYCISGLLQEWIKDSDRSENSRGRQIVVLGNAVSNWSLVKSGEKNKKKLSYTMLDAY